LERNIVDNVDNFGTGRAATPMPKRNNLIFINSERRRGR
jgi:hypothetical protein